MGIRTGSVIATMLFVVLAIVGCGEPAGDPTLTKSTYMELVDWHVSGLWVINSPVAWVRVANYNGVPVKDITFQYNTYDFDNTPLDQGTYTIEGVVPPGQMRNFIELYLGIVSLHSQKLSLKLLSVSPAS
jgi:hypothetical protein